MRPVPCRPTQPVARQPPRRGLAGSAARTAFAFAFAAVSIVLLGCATTPGADERRGVTREFAWPYDGRTYNLAFDLQGDPMLKGLVIL
ncbi:MAG: hypothetical protein OXP69_14580 [Spirochaetaceae bacterium]|nr:hypothetical protein [Spirochaetaceae bacterium]